MYRARGAAVLLAGIMLAATAGDPPRSQETLTVAGLEQPVEIIRDRWGISHIYAGTEHDLFFAQGFNAARDRLFQFEIWRRQTTGTVAEILGPRELQRDIGTRLFKFRGDMTQEMRHYHDRGDEIIPAFVDGVNAYIALTERDPDLLPVEFGLLGITPGRWTPEVVISRHQGLLGNIGEELSYGRAVAAVGPDLVHRLSDFGPNVPDLTIDPAVDAGLLTDDILAVYDAFRRPIRFEPGDIVAGARNDEAAFLEMAAGLHRDRDRLEWLGREDIGSNNWVVSGALTQSGAPIMANDPHRAQSTPSLRYWAHLVGPGWDVIGGGEPEIPGISIGHNQYGAWGLTVFSTDGEDLYVYETNPSNPNQYRYRGAWEDMNVITEVIPVEGQAAHTATLKYTRHGPVVFEDGVNHKAYAVRAAWMEVGGAPYLASLRMDQATTWEEFREACNFSNIPGENMVWADREGNIGWQAVGIAPIRRHWSGLVPVPGDGRYEWDGYLPIKAKPHVFNPAQGYFATANNDLIPRGYEHPDAVGYSWSDPFRWARLNEVLGSGRKHSIMDMIQLQTDELSIPARTLVPLLRDLEAASGATEEARRRLLAWDRVLDKNSAEAGVYAEFERAIQRRMTDRFVPQPARPYIRSLSMTKIINWLVSPPGEFGADPTAARDQLLLDALGDAVSALRAGYGDDMDRWQYRRYKHALIRHPLSPAVNAELRARLDVGPLPRGGNSYTVNNTGGGNNQTSGASFRFIVDTGNWENSVGANTPGQSGDPDSPFYRNLFEMWAQDRLFPVPYNRPRVEAVAAETLNLQPAR